MKIIDEIRHEINTAHRAAADVQRVVCVRTTLLDTIERHIDYAEKNGGESPVDLQELLFRVQVIRKDFQTCHTTLATDTTPRKEVQP